MPFNSPSVAPALALAACALSACASAPPPAGLADQGTVVRVRPIVQVVSSAPSDAVDARVFVSVIGTELRPGEAQYGASYTVRRAVDGVEIEVAQPAVPAIAAGARVRIVQDPTVRLVPN